jgi:hypothetical protein
MHAGQGSTPYLADLESQRSTPDPIEDAVLPRIEIRPAGSTTPRTVNSDGRKRPAAPEMYQAPFCPVGMVSDRRIGPALRLSATIHSGRTADPRALLMLRLDRQCSLLDGVIWPAGKGLKPLAFTATGPGQLFSAGARTPPARGDPVRAPLHRETK